MEKYVLTNDNIDIVCQSIEKVLEEFQVERHEALRIRLTLEELLLEYQERFGVTAACSVRCIKRISSIRVEVIAEGEAYDPFSKAEDEDEVIRNLLTGIGLAPAWSWKHGRNRIVFIAKKKPLSDTRKIVLAIGLAIIAGLILNSLPGELRQTINEYALTPAGDTFMGLISAVAGPLVFLSVLGSICSMENLETFGKIGSKIMKTIVIKMLLVSCLVAVFGCFIYRVELGSGGSVNFSQVLDMVYGIIPTNLFNPFLTGNAMQLIFIAVMVGLAMLTISSQINGAFRMVEQISAIMQAIMSGLSSLIPILIFILFTGMISNGNLDIVFSSGKLVAVSIAMIFVFYVIIFLRIVFLKKVSPALLLKKVYPTLIILMSTASSSAAFATNTNDAVKKLGINRQLVEFGVPLGQVLFMPDVLILLFGMEVTFARNYNIPITVSWLLIAFLTNLLVAFAVPPVPGGMMMGLSIAFTQLGIPLEIMGIALAVSTITDFPGTAVNVSGWQLSLIEVADKLNMLDHDVLQREES